MDTRRIDTGDDFADHLLAFMASHYRRGPQSRGEDVLAGVRPQDFNYRYLCAQTKLELGDVTRALTYLENKEFIRTDSILSNKAYGIRVWLINRIEDRAA